MSLESQHLGFVGLGNMGFPMLENLITKTEDTTIFYIHDINRQPVEELSAKYPTRIRGCDGADDVARSSAVIITMVPEGSHVRSVYLDKPDGILCAPLSGKTLVDCSTIDTETSLHVQSALKSQYPTAKFIDAPVSGGVLGAERATLTFMLGCSESDPHLPFLKELLSKMGRTIVPCGGPSLGLTAKLCNNYCSALIAIAVSEALNIGIRSGMDPRTLASVFHSSTAQSAICDAWNPVPGLCPDAPPSHGYKGGFKVQLMKKDFGLAVQTAERVGAKLALGEKGLELYQKAAQDGNCKDLDSRVVYRYLGGIENWEEWLDNRKDN